MDFSALFNARELPKHIFGKGYNLTIHKIISPNAFVFTVFRWAERVSEVELKSVTDPKETEIAKRLLSIDYNAEITWLK